eukprot:m.42115 g.42115  ORF g.42115 m.42115 type:complete len:222 (-) comp9847_c0_seq1:24-689(-)
MSYNGVGLTSARGSATNGYVQRNFALVRYKRGKDEEYKDEDAARTERHFSRKANPELLEHQRKRDIELKCAELEEKMEEQGYPEDEIEEKIAELRKELTAKQEAARKKLRPTDTHEMAEARERRNQIASEAFGISKDYKPGEAFDEEKQAEKRAIRQESRQRRRRDDSPPPRRRSDRRSRSPRRSRSRSRSRTRRRRRSPSSSSSSSSSSRSSRSSSSSSD